MTGFSLEPAQASDRAFSFQVYASTRQEELALTEWLPEQKEAFLNMQFELRDRQYREIYPNSQTEIILCEGVPAGAMITEQGTNDILLVDIALLPEFRGRGIGAEILRKLQSNGKKIILHVLKQNPAVHLYTRLGFVSVNEDSMYLTMEWTPR